MRPWWVEKGVNVALEALFGFAGVVLGSLTTSVLTIYRDRLTVKHESLQRDQQYERERRAARDAFQRESILSLQSAVSDLIAAAYEELDRMISEFKTTSAWPTRTWETPTAKNWSGAILRLESSRARVFDEKLRMLADEIRKLAGDSVWADSLDAAKRHSQRIEPLQSRLQEVVTRILPTLY